MKPKLGGSERGQSGCRILFFGVRREDGAFPRPTGWSALGQARSVAPSESGDTSPHSKTPQSFFCLPCVAYHSSWRKIPRRMATSRSPRLARPKILLRVCMILLGFFGFRKPMRRRSSSRWLYIPSILLNSAGLGNLPEDKQASPLRFPFPFRNPQSAIRNSHRLARYSS